VILDNPGLFIIGLALYLFVFWVFTDNSDFTLSFDDFALFANWFY